MSTTEQLTHAFEPHELEVLERAGIRRKQALRLAQVPEWIRRKAVGEVARGNKRYVRDAIRDYEEERDWYDATSEQRRVIARQRRLMSSLRRILGAPAALFRRKPMHDEDPIMRAVDAALAKAHTGDRGAPFWTENKRRVYLIDPRGGKFDDLVRQEWDAHEVERTMLESSSCVDAARQLEAEGWKIEAFPNCDRPRATLCNLRQGYRLAFLYREAGRCYLGEYELYLKGHGPAR